VQLFIIIINMNTYMDILIFYILIQLVMHDIIVNCYVNVFLHISITIWSFYNKLYIFFFIIINILFFL